VWRAFSALAKSIVIAETVCVLVVSSTAGDFGGLLASYSLVDTNC
jgi:hypothetical protein